jgi:hypothetical protein
VFLRGLAKGGVPMGIFDRFTGRKPDRFRGSSISKSSAAEEKRTAYTIAITQRMINTSLRAIEQKYALRLQPSDAKILLGIHTDLLSHAAVIAHFGGSRQGILCTHLAQVLGQCRDILTTSAADWATIAEHKLSKTDLVDAIDVILGSTLLITAQLKKNGIKDPEIERQVAALPNDECGPFAKDILRQMR